MEIQITPRKIACLISFQISQLAAGQTFVKNIQFIQVAIKQEYITVE